jgi:copper resistance protein B
MIGITPTLTLVALALSAVSAAGAEEHGQHHQAPEGAEHGQHDAQHHTATESVVGEEPTESERNHVPPPPPEHPMHDMSNEEMIELMQMDDTAAFGMLLFDQLEWRHDDEDSMLAWDAQAWYGNDLTKLWLKTEGKRVDADNEGRVELYLDRVLARWWNVQFGARQDFGEGPARTWAALGVQGLAPYWFEVEATGYVGEQGRLAATFSGEYEILLTQRLILQPKLELAAYSKDDPENGIGSGLANTELALRLRYEFRREFAPYFGVVWTHRYGNTADLARNAGRETDELQFVAGLRVWF